MARVVREPMKSLLTSGGISALIALGTLAHAQASPTAWSPQSNATGCNDGKGCHSAIIASALLGAVPTVTLGVELTSGSSIRLGTPLRIVLMAAGAASLAAGVWDGVAYRDDGASNYLPGPIVGGVLGGGTLVANMILAFTPQSPAAQGGVARWSPSAVWVRDQAGHPVLTPGVIGLLY